MEKIKSKKNNKSMCISIRENEENEAALALTPKEVELFSFSFTNCSVISLMRHPLFLF